MPLDPALSSLSISQGRVFTQVRRPLGAEDQEWCLALDAPTGQELWATPLGPAHYPDGGVGSDDGPRSTPIVDGHRVYVLTSYLRLVALDAATGAIVWSRDLPTEYQATVISWQNAASPVLAGDRLFLNGNASGRRLMAFDKQDGATLWQVENDRMTQATPIVATLAGLPQVIFFTQTGLVALAPDSGQVLWRHSLPYSTSTAASPVVGEDLVYASAAYGVGAAAVRITAHGSHLQAAEQWRTRGANMNHWATPVQHAGSLYGLFGQTLVSLRCVDLATGREQWRQDDGIGRGGLLLVSGLLLVLTEEGQVRLVQAHPQAYQEIARLHAVRGKCWNVPALSDGRLYARSTTEAVCWDIAPPAPPALPLRLQAASPAASGAFQFLLLDQDGTVPDEARLTGIQVQTSGPLSLPSPPWTPTSLTPVFTNGQWRVTDPASSAFPQRYYRVLEPP